MLKFCTARKTSPNTDVYTAYNFKDLTECISQVERIETRVNSKKRKWLTKKEEEETQRGREEEIPAITLDSYLLRITPIIDKIFPFFLYLDFLLCICKKRIKTSHLLF